MRPRRGLLLLPLAACAMLALAGCRDGGNSAPAAQIAVEPGPSKGSLDWAIAGEWRLPEEKARDRWRHPLETLRFFGIKPNSVVVEALPGAGWYSAILAPFLKEGGGELIAAGFDPQSPNPAQKAALETYRKRFGLRPDLYGSVRFTVLDPAGGRACEAGEADLALTFRNVHNWMANEWAEKAFLELWRCLKPGGILGVVEHRADPLSEQDPRALSGYVQVAFVRQLATEAGFEYLESSEINANPADTRDHPFGVWTLPPVLRTAPFGAPPDPAFDSAPFAGIGESDRMTLKFRKPRNDEARDTDTPASP